MLFLQDSGDTDLLCLVKKFQSINSFLRLWNIIEDALSHKNKILRNLLHQSFARVFGSNKLENLLDVEGRDRVQLTLL